MYPGGQLMHGHHHGSHSNTMENRTDLSMSRDKERQEARAQREKYKTTAPPKADNHPLFGVVRQGGHGSNQVQDVMGDVKSFFLIPKERSPPSANGAWSSSNSSQGQQHRSSQMQGNSTNRPRDQHGGSRSHHVLASSTSEDVRHTTVRGPGPGGGAAYPLDSTTSSMAPSSTSSSSKDLSHTHHTPTKGQQVRPLDDLEVSQIMDEIVNVKEPQPGLVQTPTPEHHSPFTFPISPIKDDAPAFQRHSQHHEGHGVPSTHAKAKSSRTGESKARLSKQTPVSLSANEKASSRLSSKEVPDSSIANGCLSSSGIPFNANSVGDPAPLSTSLSKPVSPMKSSDESSNSEEESSGSESEEESSSSEGEEGEEEEEEGPPAKASSPPSASPPTSTPSDVNQHASTWNLSSIFLDKSKDDSPSQEASKNSETFRDSVDVHSPHNNYEPSSTVSSDKRSRKANGFKMSSASYGPNLSEEDSPVESSQLTSRQKRSHKASSGSSHQHRRDRQSSKRKTALLVLDSDEEEQEHISAKKAKNSSHEKQFHEPPHKRTPNKKKAVAMTLLSKQNKKRYEEKIKQKELSALNDAHHFEPNLSEESDEEVISSPPEKNSKRGSKKQHHPNKSADSAHGHKSNGFISPIPSTHLPLNNYTNVLPNKKNSRWPAISASPKSNISIKPHNLKISDNRGTSKERSPVPKLQGASPNGYPKEKHESHSKSSTHRGKHYRDTNKVPPTAAVKVELDQCSNSAHEQRLSDPASYLPHRTCPPSPSKKGKNTHCKVPQSEAHFDNCVPKLVCSIPLKLIDRLPLMNGALNNAPSFNKKEKLNKEVLEMRTRPLHHKVKKERSLEPECPPNEDKKKAISNIFYRKRQSSLEPDKIKREKPEVIEHADDVKPSVENIKLEVKEDPTQCDLSPYGTTNASSPSSNISSISSSSSRGKHKKDKKEKLKRNHKTPKIEKAPPKSPPIEDVPPRTLAPPLPPPQQPCPDTKVPKKRQRERDASQDSARKGSKQSSNQPSKKLRQMASSNQKAITESTQESLGLSPPAAPYIAASELTTATALHSSGEINNSVPNPLQAPIASLSKPRPSPQQSSQEIAKEEAIRSTRGGAKISDHYLSEGSPEVDRSRSGGASCPYPKDRTYADETAAAVSSLPPPVIQSRPASLPPPDYGHNQLDIPCGASTEAPITYVVSQEDSGAACVPAYFLSNFERPAPEILLDFTEYTKQGKDKKYSADRQTNKSMKVMTYLEAVRYFILAGVSLEMTNGDSAYKMYDDTEKLARHVYQNIIMRVDAREEPPPLHLIRKLKALYLRCQSLLLHKLYQMKYPETKENERTLNHYFMNSTARQPHLTQSSTPPISSSTGGTTPNGNPNWTGSGSQRCPSNNSPSSMSPTPSPANSVGSDGSQSSGYTTSSPPRVQPVPLHSYNVPVDVHTKMHNHYQNSLRLYKSYEFWREADCCILQGSIVEFFIRLDRVRGPLNSTSSLQELATYTKEALDELKKCL